MFDAILRIFSFICKKIYSCRCSCRCICSMEIIKILNSNSLGEIWIRRCSICGKKEKVVFDSMGNCLSIRNIK